MLKKCFYWNKSKFPDGNQRFTKCLGPDLPSVSDPHLPAQLGTLLMPPTVARPVTPRWSGAGIFGQFSSSSAHLEDYDSLENSHTHMKVLDFSWYRLQKLSHLGSGF